MQNKSNKTNEMDPFDKMAKSVSLIKSACSMHNYTIAFSGGKDSVMMQFLCKQADVKVPLVYNNTTIDPPGTLKFVSKCGAEIRRPDETFLQLVERKGFPTQFRRFCCAVLKEKFIAEYVMIGVRADESVRRSLRYHEPEQCRIYSKRKGIKSHQLLPILQFTNDDIKEIVNRYQIEMHPDYYDEEGQFCVMRRLGCIGCPLQGNRGRVDFIKYPILLKQIILRGIKFHERHGRTKHDAYLNIVYNLFFSNHGTAKYRQMFEGLFPNDPKQLLEEYFNISLP